MHALLTAHGYRVALAATGEEALGRVSVVEPDLIVQGLNLPDISGLDLCRDLREWSAVPIIIVSTVADEQTTVKALDLGADDYITKPFGAHEFLARVRAALRRTPGESSSPVLVAGELRLDQTTRRVTLGDRELRLTPTEYQLLRCLMANAGKVITHPVLSRVLWGPDYPEDNSALRVFIAQLRRKIEPDLNRPSYIVTVPRIGYRFRSNAEPDSQGAR